MSNEQIANASSFYYQCYGAHIELVSSSSYVQSNPMLTFFSSRIKRKNDYLLSQLFVIIIFDENNFEFEQGLLELKVRSQKKKERKK